VNRSAPGKCCDPGEHARGPGSPGDEPLRSVGLTVGSSLIEKPMFSMAEHDHQMNGESPAAVSHS